MTVEQILQEVASMPVATRAFIAEKILEMLDAEEELQLSQEWLDVINQRVQDIDSENVQLVKAEQVFHDIRLDLNNGS